MKKVCKGSEVLGNLAACHNLACWCSGYFLDKVSGFHYYSCDCDLWICLSWRVPAFVGNLLSFSEDQLSQNRISDVESLVKKYLLFLFSSNLHILVLSIFLNLETEFFSTGPRSHCFTKLLQLHTDRCRGYLLRFRYLLLKI